MKSSHTGLCLFALGVCLALGSCDQLDLDPASDPPAGGTAGTGGDPGSSDGSSPGTSDPDPSDPVVSVGDVFDRAGNSGGGLMDAIVIARVRNESGTRADVNLRFIADLHVAHTAFVRVEPGTVTSVGSPRFAETINVSRVDAQGDTLGSKTFVFGIDFDEDNPAEYVIPGDPSDPGQTPGDPIPDGDTSSIAFTMPSQDVTVAPGTQVIVAWVVESPSAEAVVNVYVRRTDVTPGDLIQLGDSIPARLDESSDELLLDPETLAPGTYEVIGELVGDSAVETATAPGLIHVMATNDPPKLNIKKPASDMELRGSDQLHIAWTDSDANDNARIRLQLDPDSASGAAGRPTVPLISDVAEDDAANEVYLAMPRGVAKGAYRVRGVIDDGSVTNESESPGLVFFGVSFPVSSMTFVKPAGDVTVRPGSQVIIGWNVQLAVDSATIDLFARRVDVSSDVLNSIGGPMEVVADGGQEERHFTISNLQPGTYEIVGKLDDHRAPVFTAIAPGHMRVPGPPDVAIVEPADSLWVRVDGTIDVELSTVDAPPGSGVQLSLSNEAHGGGTANVVLADGLDPTGRAQVRLEDAQPAIANSAWPRQFDLRAALISLVGEELDTEVAPGSIWIRQEVDLLEVSYNYRCPGGSPTDPDGRLTVGITVRWMGGGFEERETHGNVYFWLSKDEFTPPDGLEDSSHRLIHTASESPNVERLFRERLSRIVSLPVGEGEEVPTELEEGSYWLWAVVEPGGMGATSAVRYPGSIPICLPITP